MNITVVGMGHFAGVVASCLAEKGHAVRQVDTEPFLLREGQKRAENEPGWMAWEQAPISTSTLPDLVWIAYDVPLDASGAPVVTGVLARLDYWHVWAPHWAPFLISCQWPVGTMRQVQARCKGRKLFYVMENVRVGKAIQDFRRQTFLAIGTDELVPPAIVDLLRPFTDCLLVMKPESAELAKHTVNAFMALQIAFINEIADLASQVGASATDISRVLLSDARVSPQAPLHAGRPFGGGSLKRDLKVLEQLTTAPIIRAILPSNESR